MIHWHCIRDYDDEPEFMCDECLDQGLVLDEDDRVVVCRCNATLTLEDLDEINACA